MKQALVTGGGGGIGSAICAALSANGYAVAVVDLRLEDARRTAEGLSQATAHAADVRQEDSVKALYDELSEAPDLVVNNAGIARFGKLLEQKVSDYEDVVQTNLVGSFIVGTEGARRMIAAGKPGSIVNITSVHSVNPGPGVGAYPATKAGLASLTRLMALEWGEHGIRVNAIAPGFIDAGMSKPFFENPRVRELRGGAVPLKRLGTGEDIANTVLYLASDAAEYVTANEIVVDGGVIHSVLMHLPRE
jgi:NAD(P)-dependent dehydrogenase (short-subunit alcohol dehydrogenase family)